MDKKDDVISDPYWCISPLDFRYYGNDEEYFRRIGPFASEAAHIKYQLKVEAALARELADWKICTNELAEEIAKACEEVTAKEVYEEERRVKHNIRALVNCIQNRVSDKAKPYVHLFATSNDVTDTANVLRLKELTAHIILPDLLRLQYLLMLLAKEYANVPQIGRTHGKHAEPITFGYYLANYISRFSTRIQMIFDAMNNLRGKFSGAVGAYNGLSLVGDDPALFELNLLRRLDLKPSESSVSTQIVQPEFVTDLMYSIVSCFSVLANLADDIRHLHRTEIGEVQEIYQVDDIGSSTMPHKVNPKNFEHVKSMWKAQMPRMITVFMDQISEHQRDLTNSASERFTIETFVAFDYCITRMISALRRIGVNKERMKKNLEMSQDLIIAEPLYMLLAMHGFSEAYVYVRTLVAKAVNEQKRLGEIIWKDDRINHILDKLTPFQAQVLRDPSKYIGASKERTLIACDNAEISMQNLILGLPAKVRAELEKELNKTKVPYSSYPTEKSVS